MANQKDRNSKSSSGNSVDKSKPFSKDFSKSTTGKIPDGKVNTDLSSWGKQFKKAIKEDYKPESDLWGGVQNAFDRKEW